MAPPLELSIPSTTISSPEASKPYTLYNITLRLPLRTYVVQKRYSEFTTLHSTLTSSHPAPPAPLPGKSWWKSTASSPALTEERRKGLEQYLRAIAEDPDRRWRETEAWKKFLKLPTSSGGGSSIKSDRAAAAQQQQRGALTADPGVWLDVHKELKGELHDARLALGRRDGATTAQAQYEAGAAAKKSLVKAGALVGNLEEGLKAIEKGRTLGQGECRRRRDLLGAARKDKEGLEGLAKSLAAKSGNNNGPAAATVADKNALFGPGVSRPSGGRVLGAPVPETDKTRELDNEGVLQLQKQLMRDQDLDVEELGKIVRRQREMGYAIQEEVQVQNEMLKRVDEDVDRVQGKITVAKKRIGKIK